MASYYYLISSLPTLRADAPLPFDYDCFLELCRTSVSSKVYARLELLDLNSNEGTLVQRWAEFYGRLTAEINRQRLVKQGKSSEPCNETDKDICELANSAMKAKNPLEAEKILLNAQFEYLDKLVSMHYFDDYVLFGYAMKLKLLERQTVFDKAKGKEEFSFLFESLRTQIMNI